jgi:hypothetical protein
VSTFDNLLEEGIPHWQMSIYPLQPSHLRIANALKALYLLQISYQEMQTPQLGQSLPSRNSSQLLLLHPCKMYLETLLPR